jgi:branched-chain amino acid transport system ATP-binding protein
MSSGEVLVEGTPDAVLADPRVMEAYLGKATA